jgi:hypothetical protein
MNMKVTFMDLLFFISAITEDNNINTLDELFNYLQENRELFIEIESI